MGIQSSINKVLGTAAAAAVAGKKGQEAKEKETESGLLAKEQFHEASAELTTLTGEQEAAGKTLEEKTAISDALANKKPGGKGNTKKALEDKRAAALTEKEAAQRAFDTLSDKMEAKKAMMLRAQMVMKRTGIGESK